MKQNKHFQKTACFTVTIWKIIFIFTNEQFSVVLSIGQQNDHFQEITCIRCQRSYTVQCLSLKNCGFSLKSIILVYQLMQSDMISCRLVGLIKQKSCNLCLLPFAVSSQKIVYFHKMNRFQRN